MTSHDEKKGRGDLTAPRTQIIESEPSNEIDTFPTQMLARDRTFVNTRLLNKPSLRYIIMADLIYRYEGITYLVSCRRAYETGPARRPRYHLNLTRDTAVCRRLYFYTGDVMHGWWQRTPSHGKQQECEVGVGACVTNSARGSNDWRAARGVPLARVPPPCPALPPPPPRSCSVHYAPLQPPHGRR